MEEKTPRCHSLEELTPEQLELFKKIEKEKGVYEAVDILPVMDTDETSDPVNSRIKAIRLENGLSQNDLANILGVSQRVYWRYEQTGYKVSPRTLRKIATFYNVSADWFIGAIDEEKPLYEAPKRFGFFSYTLDEVKQIKAQGYTIQTFYEIYEYLRNGENKP